MAINRDDLLAENEQLTQQLSDPAVTQNPKELARLAKRKNQVEGHLSLIEEIKDEVTQITELEAMVDDASVGEMAKAELDQHRQKHQELTKQLGELIRPRDPNEDKNVIMEIRAGAGGDEASLFASELFTMYVRYAESQGWKAEVLSESASEAGGYKEITFSITGDGAFGALRYEAGTHRVQRVPVTESGGRIHTSTVTVAVLPEAQEQDVEIKPDEIRVDVYRSSGPGGQSVNTTDSAVRITHLPTGITVSMQDEKSQHKNRAKAMSVLRARLQAKQIEDAAAERGDARRQQIGTGDRSEKIRTYNFPQDRLTDHRINYSRHGLPKVMEGDLEAVVTALQDAARQQADG